MGEEPLASIFPSRLGVSVAADIGPRLCPTGQVGGRCTGWDHLDGKVPARGVRVKPPFGAGKPFLDAEMQMFFLLLLILIPLMFSGGGYYGHRQGYYGRRTVYGGIGLGWLLFLFVILFLMPHWGYRAY